MSDVAQKHEILQYLLGSLPEAETERLDELSISDDAFAAAISEAENDLIDRYVQGELHGADLERFESHYLASPLRRQRAEFATSLQVYGEKKAIIQNKVAARTKTGWFAAIFGNQRPVFQWALALATLVL